MLDGLLHLISRRSPFEVLRDLADIWLVAFVVYRALLVLRGTRAQQMGIGLLIISALYVLAKFAGFVTILNLLSAVLSSIVLIVVVVFQNDIRRALIRVGDRAWLPGFSRAAETKVIEEVVAAATELARHRVGALIAFEQDANLDEFTVGQGIALDAQPTRELLVTIFQPESINKLHDGSVVIRNFRLASAGVFFPMPEQRVLDASLGSRHRAALGITEETDAVVVVVSEERGTITVCFRGNMIPNLDGQKLRAVLFDLFGHKPKRAAKKPEVEAPAPAAPAPRREPPPAPRPPSPSIPGASPSMIGKRPRELQGLQKKPVEPPEQEPSSVPAGLPAARPLVPATSSATTTPRPSSVPLPPGGVRGEE